MTATGGAIPTTIVTGFLGSGKTTLVNHVLTDLAQARVAVLVNEFGELGIDGDLIARTSSNVMELKNGCMCCATGGEILRSLNELLATVSDLDHVLIETSGLADPAPIVESLTHLRFNQELRIDAVVTVVDALNFDRNLDQAEIALNQITYGDVLLVNKADLVDARTPELIEEGIRKLNPSARIAPCARCEVPVELLLGPVERRSSGSSHGHSHEHGHLAAGFESVSVATDTALDRTRFQQWLSGLPVDVFRAKGFVRFTDDPAGHVFQRVGERNELSAGTEARDRQGAELVLIGRALQRDKLIRTFYLCAQHIEPGTTQQGDADGG